MPHRLSSSRVFLVQALVAWGVLCLPGNLVTIVLYFKGDPASNNDLAKNETNIEVGVGGGNNSNVSRFN